jgi:hypothetical protein
MSIDATANFSKATVSTGYNSAAVSIVLNAGGGALFPAVPFNAVWWNSTDYADPTDDPNREIVRVTAIATDTLTITRAQEGTLASTKNTAGKTYLLLCGLTAKTVSDLAQNLSFACGPMSVPLQNVKYPSVYSLALGTGNTDLYTVPAGRKALLIDTVCTLVGGGTWTIFHQLKVGASYFKFGFAVSAQAAANGLSNSAAPFLLNAGESYAVNNNQTGTSTSIWPYIIEFDASAPIFRSSLGSFSAGNNTIFTVPAACTISLYGMPSGFALAMAGVLLYFNASGATRTVSWNAVPNGGSPAAANLIQAATAVPDGTMNNAVFWGGLAAGDFININTDASTAGQVAWVNYVKMAL